MARNRKRRNDRRPGRPADSAGAPGLATARGQRAAAETEGDEAPDAIAHGASNPIAGVTPDPIEPVTQADHSPPELADDLGSRAPASGEVELAEAQLAVGRPDEDGDTGEVFGDEIEDENDEGMDDEELALADGGGGSRSTRRRRGSSLTPRPGGAPAPRSGNRLLHFLQGSWRELQRVQWPDRRQVMQATSVVIGFVIVAGAFLGAADWVATKLVHIILQ